MPGATPDWLDSLIAGLQRRAVAMLRRTSLRTYREDAAQQVGLKIMQLYDEGRLPEADALDRMIPTMIRNAASNLARQAGRSKTMTSASLDRRASSRAPVRDEPAEALAEDPSLTSGPPPTCLAELLAWGRAHTQSLRLYCRQPELLALPDGLSDREAAKRVGMAIRDYKRAQQRLEQRLKKEWWRLGAVAENIAGSDSSPRRQGEGRDD